MNEVWKTQLTLKILLITREAGSITSGNRFSQSIVTIKNEERCDDSTIILHPIPCHQTFSTTCLPNNCSVIVNFTNEYSFYLFCELSMNVPLLMYQAKAWVHPL